MGTATQGQGGPLVNTLWSPAAIGSASGASNFEADGTYVATGAATVYNDIFLPLSPRTTGAGSPTRRQVGGNIYKFTMAVNDVCEIDAAEFLHDWKEGSAIEVHVHWATRGANNSTARGVKFEVDYSWANMGDAYPAVQTLTQEGPIAALAPDLLHTYTTIGTITPTGGKIGGNIILSLKRVTSVATAPANDPWVMMVGIHYESDTLGSRTISGK